MGQQENLRVVEQGAVVFEDRLCAHYFHDVLYALGTFDRANTEPKPNDRVGV